MLNFIYMIDWLKNVIQHEILTHENKDPANLTPQSKNLIRNTFDMKLNASRTLVS